MEPFVAIILVNYNGFIDTVECVKSLKKIGYRNYRIIIVDNGSTQQMNVEQEAFLRKNAEIIFTNRNLGFSGGNNIGIRRAVELGAQYFLLLNNDTVVKQDFLTHLVKTALNYTNAGLICGKIYWFDEPEMIWYAGGTIDRKTCITTHYRYNKKDILDDEKTKPVTFASGCMWLVPKKTVDRIGVMSEAFFLYSEDDDYCCRVCDAGLDIIYCPQSVIYHKVSRSTGAQSKDTQYYLARNRALMIQQYSTNKAYAYFKYLKSYAKKMISGNMDVRSVVCGVIDAARGKTGKREGTRCKGEKKL